MEVAIAIPVAIVACGIAIKFSDVVRWCRWIYAYIYIKYHRRFTKQRLDLYDMEALQDPVKIGLLPPQEEIFLESPQNGSHLQKANDEVSFYGVNSTSECFMARIARGPDVIDSWIYLRLKNGNAYQLDISDQNTPSTTETSKIFSCRGLKVHYIEPMRIWRIFFHGLMKEIAENGEATGKMVCIKFVFRWRSSTDCFDTFSDINISCLASGFARGLHKGLSSYLTLLKTATNSYSQGGIISGEVTVDSNLDTLKMYLFGHRMRYLGNMGMIPNSKMTHLFGWMSKYGTIVHFTELSLPNLIENLLYGYVVTPDGKIEVAERILIEKGKLTDQNEHILISCHADGTNQVFKGNSDGNCILFGSKSTEEFKMSTLTTELTSYSGKGILMQRTFYKMRTKTIVKPFVKSAPKVVPLVVTFSDVLCQNVDITGGKGSSLRKLAEKSEECHSFIVPNGIVVTTKAYKEIIADNIASEVQNLENILYGNVDGDVNEACSMVMKAVIQTEVFSNTLTSISESLRDKFGDNFEQKTFAVRSSALGEDTEDMSAAGQMETYLGVSGLDQIVKSIKKCWASQFGHVAVQYKRKNGQVLDSPMAVVVQEMVPCDIAGVIFTCDPLTGNPTLLTITSNYGLGESVVSGAEEPDTIVLERDVDDNLTIKQRTIGAKNHRFVLKGDEGIDQEDIPEAERNSCSLTDILSIRLGEVAINIEKVYGSPRDIEWGYWNNDLYLFQSRHVTNIADETDYEIDHESDSPLKVENDYFTVCNVGEVMPGATSPLSIEMMKKGFGALFQKKMFKDYIAHSPKYCPKGITSLYSHMMMYGSDLFVHINESEAMVKSQMINFFGRVIEEDDLFDLARERHRRRKNISFVKLCLAVVMILFLPSWMIRQTRKFYASYRIEVEKFKTSQELFHAILHTCTDHAYTICCHIMCTSVSAILNNFLVSLLEKAKGELDADVYSDLSLLLSSITEIESAGVPSELESLASHIVKDMDPVQFQKMKTDDAKTWLLSSTTESGEKFRDFLKKHGHRCLKELDLREFTWEEKPEYLVETLQGLVGSVTADKIKKEKKSFQQMISQLKTPLGAFNRLKLRYFFMPFCRRGVQFRETAKSLWVKGQHHWSMGYKALGKLMVAEGRLPDGDLIFFMNMIEIQELLQNRSSKIISRALHRRRRHQILDGYIFPEIMSGLPTPINMMSTSEETPMEEISSMKGLPVSRGIAKGYARVAMTLKEASHLKAGEILLTYSTDIGWTPYFPALAGVGTELGGLISHGAVVSREYGLPCVAGLHGVTRQFKTGDYILLDGTRGILQKLPKPE